MSRFGLGGLGCAVVRLVTVLRQDILSMCLEAGMLAAVLRWDEFIKARAEGMCRNIIGDETRNIQKSSMLGLKDGFFFSWQQSNWKVLGIKIIFFNLWLRKTSNKNMIVVWEQPVRSALWKGIKDRL